MSRSKDEQTRSDQVRDVFETATGTVEPDLTRSRAAMPQIVAEAGAIRAARENAGPIVVIAGLLVLAKRRVDAMASDRSGEHLGTDDAGSDSAADRHRDGVDVE